MTARVLTRLKLARLTVGLHQAEVAATIHLSAPRLSLIESGRADPSLRELAALSDFYGVEPDALLGEVDASGILGGAS